MVDSAAALEGFRPPQQERPHVEHRQEAPPMHRSEMQGGPSDEPDFAKISKLQQMLQQAAHETGTQPPAEMTDMLKAQQETGPNKQTKFSLTKWFSEVFNYLTNNMFVKKK